MEMDDLTNEEYFKRDDEFSASVGPWVAEWCSTGDQKGTFHIDTLKTSITSNIDVFLGIGTARYITPWIILGVFRTSREAGKYLDHLQEIQENKSPGWEVEDDRIFIPATENPERVQALQKMPYRDYLASGHWQDIRKYALEHAKHRCQVCNVGGRVDVHHRTYENRGDERFSDVIVLCRDCHDLFHKMGKLAKSTGA